MRKYFTTLEKETAVSVEHPDLTKTKTYLYTIIDELKIDKQLPENLSLEILLSNRIDAMANRDKSKPRIILSQGLLKFCTRGELKFVVSHELSHLIYPGSGLRIEENRCDLYAVQWLENSGTSAEVGINFFRKIAKQRGYRPDQQSYYDSIQDVHSPLEQRIKHIQSWLANKNKYGVPTTLLTLDSGETPKSQIDILHNLFLQVESEKKAQSALSFSKDSIQSFIVRLINLENHENDSITKFCSDLKSYTIDKNDEAQMVQLNQLIDKAFEIISVEKFVMIYESAIVALISSEGAYSGSFIPLGIFQRLQKHIELLIGSATLQEAHTQAKKINELVPHLKSAAKQFKKNSMVMRIWLFDRKDFSKTIDASVKASVCFKLIEQDASGEIALALWNIGFYKESVINESMFSHNLDKFRRDTNNFDEKPTVAVQGLRLIIGGYERYDTLQDEYKYIKKFILKPYLGMLLSKKILENSDAFKQEIISTDFSNENAYKAFVDRYDDVISIYECQGKIKNINNEIVRLLLDTFEVMLLENNRRSIRSIQGFFLGLQFIRERSAKKGRFFTTYDEIPMQSPYADFIFDHLEIFQMSRGRNAFDLLFGCKSPFDRSMAYVVFLEKVIGKEPQDFSDITSMVDHCSKLGILPSSYGKEIMIRLLSIIYDTFPIIAVPKDHDKGLGQVIQLIDFINKGVSNTCYKCLDLKHKILKEKIQWQLPEEKSADLSVICQRYQAIPYSIFIEIYLLYESSCSFVSTHHRDFFGKILIEKIQSLDFDVKLRYLDILIIEKSLSDYSLRQQLTHIFSIAQKELATKKSFSSDDIFLIFNAVIHNAPKRDRLFILDSLTSVFQSQLPELMRIYKGLNWGKHYEIRDTLESHTLFVGVEALLKYISKYDTLRYQFIDFLVNPISYHRAIDMGRMLVDMGESIELYDLLKGIDQSYLAHELSEEYTQHILTHYLYNIHVEYHHLPIEARAGFMNYLLIPSKYSLTAESEQAAYQRALDYVTERLFPSDAANSKLSQYGELARTFLFSYIDQSPPYTKYVLLAGLLAASHSTDSLTNKSVRIGQLLAAVCAHMGPAYTKLAQGIHSHYETPADIKQDLKHIKANVNMPYLWDLAKRIEDLPKVIRDQITYVGPRLGAASYNIAWQVVYNGKEAVLLLPRENVIESARHGFDHLLRTLSHWSHPDVAKMRNTLTSIIRHTQAALEKETNYSISLHQEDMAEALYAGMQVIDQHKIVFTPMKTLVSGQNFRLLEKAPGHHFNDLPNQSVMKRCVARATVIMELRNMLTGRPFDSDRHGCQMRIVQLSSHLISVGLFDFGEMSLKAPHAKDIQQLSDAIPYLISDLVAKRYPNIILPSFQDYLDQLEAQSIPVSSHLSRCYRALLALQDYMQALHVKDVLDILKSVLRLTDIAPQIKDSLTLAIDDLSNRLFNERSISSKLGALALKTIIKNPGKTSLQLQQLQSQCTALVHCASPEYQQSHQGYYSAWDLVQAFHPQTGQPIFTVRVFSKNKAEIGRARFYAHPLLCVSKAGDRTNLLEATGVLFDAAQHIELDKIEDVCIYLPPTNFETMTTAATQGIAPGLMRSIGRITEQFIRKLHPSMAWFAGKVLYYSLFYSWRYYQYSTQDASNEWFSHTQAALETAGLVLFDGALAVTSAGLRLASRKSRDLGYSRLANTLGFFAAHSPKTTFVYSVYHQGIPAATTGVVMGVVAEASLCGLFGCGM